MILNEVSDHFGILTSFQNKYQKVIIDKNVLTLYKGMLKKCSFNLLNSDELDINAKSQNWY